MSYVVVEEKEEEDEEEAKKVLVCVEARDCPSEHANAPLRRSELGRQGLCARFGLGERIEPSCG